MQIDIAEALGLVAGFVGAFAFAPQAFKIIRERDASGVSGLTYAMVFDDGSKVAAAYGVRNLPTLVVIGKSGKVLAVRTRVVRRAELDELVSMALRD